MNFQLPHPHYANPHLAPDHDFCSASSPEGQPRSITPNFLDRDAVSVAHDLIGTRIVSSLTDKALTATITEVVAYPGKNDPDTHLYRTPKGSLAPERKPGSLYVYSVQGHAMLTIATPPYSEGGCVLIRAVQLESGEQVNGPGKVSKALGINTALNGQNLFHECGVRIEGRTVDSVIQVEACSRGSNSKAPQLLYRFKMK